jgi:acetylornithine deacetylase/succinyl-diaminopimelate desuccinylase-like protein
MGNVFNLSAIAFHLCLLIPTFAQATPIDIDLALTRALEYVAARESQYIQDLKTLVSFPSISASPDRLPDLQQTARWLEKRLTDAGLHDVKILPNPEGPRPAVYAEYNFQQGPDSSSPTVLVYGHFDVQPAAPESAWTSPPFSPEIRNGALFGRGASDDKGGLLAPIQAIEALIRANATFPLKVKLMLEGEEEIGSPCLEPFLKKYKNQLACDLVLSADGGQINASTPGIALSLRGAVAVEAEVTALPRDAHSGMVGGAVQNSARAIAHIVASLHDPDTNAVRVDGFYDRYETFSSRLVFFLKFVSEALLVCVVCGW